jgi:hypothetical protein
MNDARTHAWRMLGRCLQASLMHAWRMLGACLADAWGHARAMQEVEVDVEKDKERRALTSVRGFYSLCVCELFVAQVRA